MAHSTHTSLLSEIEGFLAETGMGEAYFGRKAARNTEVVKRLRNGRKIWPETADRIRDYMAQRRTPTETKAG